MCSLTPRIQLLLAVLGALISRNTALLLSIDLGGDDWTVTNSNGSIVIPATVPGQIHTDLLKAGEISEPFYGFNVDLQRWVAMENWTYTKSFELDPITDNDVSVQLVSMGTLFTPPHDSVGCRYYICLHDRARHGCGCIRERKQVIPRQ